MDYCSKTVRSFIQTTDGYRNTNWALLKAKLLASFDAERNEPKYIMTDVFRLVQENCRKPITRLEKWKKYVLDFETIAGYLHNKGQMSEWDYFGYFWTGIHQDTKSAFQPMLMVDYPSHDMSKPYSITEVNTVAEKHYKRDRFSDLLPALSNWRDASDSDSDYDSDTEDDDSDSDSDSEDDRRRRRKEKGPQEEEIQAS